MHESIKIHKVEMSILDYNDIKKISVDDSISLMVCTNVK